MTATLLVFLKHPTPFKVKTRLATVIGAQAAASLYTQWITQVLEQLQPLRPSIRLVACYAGGEARDFAPWHKLIEDWWEQAPGDLGKRLTAAFTLAHQAGGPVLAIGTDCLEIEEGLVKEAMSALVDHDAVFGPAIDGGYYLVGTGRPLLGFFEGIRWSTSHTLADSLACCHRHGWTTSLLPTRQDIDTWEDWQAYGQRVSSKDQHRC